MTVMKGKLEFALLFLLGFLLGLVLLANDARAAIEGVTRQILEP